MFLFFFIISIQLSLILSKKCYSIPNCLICPELDYCQLCESGFKINKPKTKCKNIHSKIKLPIIFLNRSNIFVNKTKNIPIQNITSSKNLRDESSDDIRIKKIILFISILFVLSLIATVINNFYEKKVNKGLSEDKLRDESTKVAEIR